MCARADSSFTVMLRKGFSSMNNFSKYLLATHEDGNVALPLYLACGGLVPSSGSSSSAWATISRWTKARSIPSCAWGWLVWRGQLPSSAAFSCCSLRAWSTTSS